MKTLNINELEKVSGGKVIFNSTAAEGGALLGATLGPWGALGGWVFAGTVF